MQLVNFLSADLYSYVKMKLNTTKTCKNGSTRASDMSDTSATRATRMRFEYYTNDASATRVLHELDECTREKF